jgi:tetratricopeptide (TPR) repeat protein
MNHITPDTLMDPVLDRTSSIEDSSDEDSQGSNDCQKQAKGRKVLRISNRLPKLADLKIEEETEMELNAESTKLSTQEHHIQVEEKANVNITEETNSQVPVKRHSHHRRAISNTIEASREIRGRTLSHSPTRSCHGVKEAPESIETGVIHSTAADAPETVPHSIQEDPRAYYARKRRLSLSVGGIAQTTNGSIHSLSAANDHDDSADILASTSSALYSSMQSSIFTIDSDASLSRATTSASFIGKNNNGVGNNMFTGEADAAAELLSQTLAQAMSTNGFLKAGNTTLFEVTHDKLHRSLILTDLERFKYSTYNDPGIAHDPFTEMPIEDPELIELEKDPHIEIDKLNVAIKQSSAPVPSNFRRRGYLLMKLGKYEESLQDLDKAIAFGRICPLSDEKRSHFPDPFNTDAFWFRHQLHLRSNDVELALKDLNSITDNNKSHFGAFDAKARIYHALSLDRLAIVNYSAVIRLKPDIAYGYYRRACLFEKENDSVYANEDFKSVRQLDPTNEHAIFNLAMYSFQRQLWEDAIQAFTKLISMSPENGQGYLFRGRAYASLFRWDEALEDLTASIQICPDKYQGFFHRGCLLQERNPGQALIDFSTSILLDDSVMNADAFYHRSLIHMKRGEDEAALLDLKTVVALDDTKSLAYLELGVLSMRLSKDHDLSLSYLNKSIAHGTQ